jgi:predicted phosphodiesterase
MQVALISDIHSNLDALQAVLDQCRTLGADEVLCLGDIVGYGADPNACIALLRGEGIPCVLGNHDACAAGIEEPDGFTPLAKTALLWTREQLTDQNKRFLAGLPRHRLVHGACLFHGWVNDWDSYLLSRSDASENFGLLAGMAEGPAAGFFGHTHLPAVFVEEQGEVSGAAASGESAFSADRRMLVNPGSVGQPRDGDPRAAFAIYDPGRRHLSFRRVVYAVQSAAEKIKQAGLPQELGERLSWGR